MFSKMIGLESVFRKCTKIINLTRRQNSNFYKNLVMNQVYFKHNIDDQDQADKMIISFRLQKRISETKMLDKNFNFCRQLTEPVSKTLERIKNNVEKEIKSKSKKKSKKDTPAGSSEEFKEVKKFNFRLKIQQFNYFRYQLNSFKTTMKFMKKPLRICWVALSHRRRASAYV